MFPLRACSHCEQVSTASTFPLLACSLCKQVPSASTVPLRARSHCEHVPTATLAYGAWAPTCCFRAFVHVIIIKASGPVGGTQRCRHYVPTVDALSRAMRGTARADHQGFCDFIQQCLAFLYLDKKPSLKRTSGQEGVRTSHG